MRALTLGMGLALAGGAALAEVGGTYRVEGVSLGGNAYTGTATIARESDVACRINWTIGADVSDGICMISGKTLSAAYRISDSIGMLIFEIQDNGELHGFWTIMGREGNGYERLIPATN